MLSLNPSAAQAVYNADSATIQQGCAVLPSGGITSRAANVKLPTAADSWFVGVAAVDVPPGTDGLAYQHSMSNVQVRLASGVARNAFLRVANASGEFETAPAGSQNAGLVALSAGTAGTNTTWAAPIGTRAL